uniref:Ig-like domain-containing protein n=1 Tax=Gouania willdenowi TaxID=441366 RepID=A0A8C5EKI2_GOUWI
MVFPSALSALWSAILLTVLLTTAVYSNVVYDDDPLQPVTADETVSVGGTVTLTCRVAESDNSSLQWSNTAQQTLYFGEKRALRDNRIQLLHSTSTELTITIADVQLSDEGEYKCAIFTMPVRTARATVTVLGVPGKPQISGLETPVQEGQKVTLTCTSTGSKPPAKLHWYRGDQELEGHLDVVESNPDDPTYNVSSELTLEVTSSDDNALITCAVDHPSLAPGDKRSEQTLRVLYSPNVQIHPGSNLPREGEKFSLRCTGTSNPEPTSYIWEKKDGELPILAKADGAVLHFPMLNKSDNGVYVCHADNGIGNNQGEYILLVQDPADKNSELVTPSSSPFTSSSLLPTTFPTDVDFDSGSTSSLDIISTDYSHPTHDAPTFSTTTLSNALFPDLPFSPDSVSPSLTPPAFPSSIAPSSAIPSYSTPSSSLTPSVSVQQNGVYNVPGKASYTLEHAHARCLEMV